MEAYQDAIGIDAEDGTPDDGAGGERALMRAVVIDAIRCLVAPPRVGRGAPEAARARTWIASRDRKWPFSFEPICDALGLDANALRHRLREAPDSVAVALRGGERQPRKVRPGVANNIFRLVEAGHSPRDVAAILGVSIRIVVRLVARHGGNVIARRDAEVRRLRRAGGMLRDIADRFGLSPRTVLRISARMEAPARAAAESTTLDPAPGTASCG